MASKIDPVGGPRPVGGQEVLVQSAASMQRAVKAQVDTLGGAVNYAAQSTVQRRQDLENQKKTGKLIDRKITTPTLLALEPLGSAHDEDEADKERANHAFGSELPFDYPKGGPPSRQAPRKKR